MVGCRLFDERKATRVEPLLNYANTCLNFPKSRQPAAVSNRMSSAAESVGC
jgi:hypothetical protein